MKPSYSVLGFVAVAILIGILEWRSGEQAANNELLVSEAQRAFVREQVLQAGTPAAGSANYEQAMATYIDEEILYREGLKLGLEKDDLIVKRRVVQKMRFLLEDMTPIAPPPKRNFKPGWIKTHNAIKPSKPLCLITISLAAANVVTKQYIRQALLATTCLLASKSFLTPFPCKQVLSY